MHPEVGSSDSQVQNQSHRERRRHDSTSGGEEDGLGSSGSGLRRSSSRTLGGGSHRAHPYLSRLPSTSSPSASMGSNTRGHSHQQQQNQLSSMESPASATSGANFDFEPDSPSAITAASLLSLASSSSNSSHTFLPSLGSNRSADQTPPGSSGLGAHGADVGVASIQMDFSHLPNAFSQHAQQPHQPQDPAQTHLLDPYLVDFDPFSATGWATLEQDPFQQSFYMDA